MKKRHRMPTKQIGESVYHIKFCTWVLKNLGVISTEIKRQHSKGRRYLLQSCESVHDLENDNSKKNKYDYLKWRSEDKKKEEKKGIAGNRAAFGK